MVPFYVMCVTVITVRYSIEKCVNVSVYVMCVRVVECTVKYREMCYYIRICNVCNGDGVYGTV